MGVSILGVVMDSPPPGGIPGSRDVIMTSQREFLKVTAVNVLVWSPGAIECATPRLAPSCLAVRGGYPRSSSGYFFYKKLHFDTATFQTWSVYPAPHVTSGSFFFIRSSTLTLLRFRRDPLQGILGFVLLRRTPTPIVTS